MRRKNKKWSLKGKSRLEKRLIISSCLGTPSTQSNGKKHAIKARGQLAANAVELFRKKKGSQQTNKFLTQVR